MRTFIVRLNDGTTLSVIADFMTRAQLEPLIQLWAKPHWYSRRRCVGVISWNFVTSISLTETAADVARELGVKI